MTRKKEIRGKGEVGLWGVEGIGPLKKSEHLLH
jgi:hypothetical protein